jgi:hypothetical protein
VIVKEQDEELSLERVSHFGEFVVDENNFASLCGEEN